MTPANLNYQKNQNGVLSQQYRLGVIIRLKSTLADKHLVVGAYFPLEQYYIVFTPDEDDADDSILEIGHTERFVGEPAKIFITHYD